jgi:hypothetical protein
MKKFLWAAAALGAALALGGIDTAKADFSFDLPGGGTLAGSVGSLQINQPSSGEIDYVVTLNQGAIWNSGITSFFADVTGTISSVKVTAGDAPSGVTFNTGFGTGTVPNADGLKGSNAWDVWADCVGAGGTTNCGTTLTVQVLGTGLGFLPETISGNNVYAGLDVTCKSGNLGSVAATACSPGSAQAGQTGAVGATFVNPPVLTVPGPILGGGLPGLIAACAGLMALARRRRRFA